MSSEQYQEVLTFSALATGAGSPMALNGGGGRSMASPVYGAVHTEQGAGTSWHDTTAGGGSSSGYHHERRPPSSQSTGGGGGGGITGLFTGFMDKMTGHSEDTDDDQQHDHADADANVDDSFDVSVGDEDRPIFLSSFFCFKKAQKSTYFFYYVHN